MDPASKFHIGTSGYSFPDWVGPFYPPGTRRQEMFAYYDEELTAVYGTWSRLAEQVDCVCAFFNNCRHGQAARNARRFMEIVCGGPANSPPPS